MDWPLLLPILLVAFLLLLGLRRVRYRYLLYPWHTRHAPLGLESPPTPIEFSATSPEAAERLAGTARELALCGFAAAAHFRLHPSLGGPQHDAYLSVWCNERDAIVGRMIWARFSNPELRYALTSFAISFTTTFDDRCEIVTTNAPTVSPYPPDPRVDAVGWKDMNHATMLYKLHRARVAGTRNGRGTIMPAAGPAGIEALVREAEQRVITVAIEQGYLRRDDAGEVRKTLRGSYLMVWRLLWPWKQLKQARHARKLQRVLADSPELAREARALPATAPAMQEQLPT